MYQSIHIPAFIRQRRRLRGSSTEDIRRAAPDRHGMATRDSTRESRHWSPSLKKLHSSDACLLEIIRPAQSFQVEAGLKRFLSRWAAGSLAFVLISVDGGVLCKDASSIALSARRVLCKSAWAIRLGSCLFSANCEARGAAWPSKKWPLASYTVTHTTAVHQHSWAESSGQLSCLCHAITQYSLPHQDDNTPVLSTHRVVILFSSLFNPQFRVFKNLFRLTFRPHSARSRKFSTFAYQAHAVDKQQNIPHCAKVPVFLSFHGRLSCRAKQRDCVSTNCFHQDSIVCSF